MLVCCNNGDILNHRFNNADETWTEMPGTLVDPFHMYWGTIALLDVDEDLCGEEGNFSLFSSGANCEAGGWETIKSQAECHEAAPTIQELGLPAPQSKLLPPINCHPPGLT